MFYKPKNAKVWNILCFQKRNSFPFPNISGVTTWVSEVEFSSPRHTEIALSSVGLSNLPPIQNLARRELLTSRQGWIKGVGAIPQALPGKLCSLKNKRFAANVKVRYGAPRYGEKAWGTPKNEPGAPQSLNTTLHADVSEAKMIHDQFAHLTRRYRQLSKISKSPWFYQTLVLDLRSRRLCKLLSIPRSSKTLLMVLWGQGGYSQLFWRYPIFRIQLRSEIKHVNLYNFLEGVGSAAYKIRYCKIASASYWGTFDVHDRFSCDLLFLGKLQIELALFESAATQYICQMRSSLFEPVARPFRCKKSWPLHHVPLRQDVKSPESLKTKATACDSGPVSTRFCAGSYTPAGCRSRYRCGRIWVQFPTGSHQTRCRQRLATAAMFFRSYVAKVLNHGDGSRHSLHASVWHCEYNEG